MGFIICLFVYDLGAIAYNTLVTQMFLVFAIIYTNVMAVPKKTPITGPSKAPVLEK